MRKMFVSGWMFGINLEQMTNISYAEVMIIKKIYKSLLSEENLLYNRLKYAKGLHWIRSIYLQEIIKELQYKTSPMGVLKFILGMRL